MSAERIPLCPCGQSPDLIRSLQPARGVYLLPIATPGLWFSAPSMPRASSCAVPGVHRVEGPRASPPHIEPKTMVLRAARPDSDRIRWKAMPLKCPRLDIQSRRTRNPTRGSSIAFESSESTREASRPTNPGWFQPSWRSSTGLSSYCDSLVRTFNRLLRGRWSCRRPLGVTPTSMPEEAAAKRIRGLRGEAIVAMR
jgi:hypothetical protein